MLYTRKGDAGTTKDFNSKPGERKSKSSCQTESLGALDELGAFLGLIKLKSAEVSWSIDGDKPVDIILWTQNCLFTVQAEIAGADKRVGHDKVLEMERWVDWIEKELPPIKTFFISGGTELAALFDVSRTLARKAERRVIAGIEAKEFAVAPDTLAFLNRLSSLFYAFARLTNHKSGITEQPPTYQ
jgi:cob(I)alamin adenosyltransferase